MLSILSNSLIIHVIRRNPIMRTTTNYLILNMVVGDLTGMFAIAGCIKYLYTGFEWSPAFVPTILCKGYFYIINISLYCSMYSLVAISYDRFIAVRHPLNHVVYSSRTRITIPLIWLISLSMPYYFAFHQISVQKHSNTTYYCGIDKDTMKQTSSLIYGLIYVLIGFIIPHVAMVIIYVIIGFTLWSRRLPGNQSRDMAEQSLRNLQKTAQHVTSMVVCVVIVFELCMAPLFSFYILPTFISRQSYKPPSLTLPIVTILLSLNGVFSTIVYFTFASSFRQAFCRCFPRLRRFPNARGFSTRIRSFPML